MTVNLSALAGAGAQFLDNNGNILSGGKLYSYAAGTTTPQTTYTSASGSASHTNPIILNSAGRVATGEIWLTEGAEYKFSLYTSSNVLIATYDNVPGINDLTSLNNFISNLANTANPALGDALVGFRQSDSNGNLVGSVGRTVHQKLQELISVLDFGAVGNGIADDTAAIQAAIDYLGSRNGGSVYLPEGKYRVTSSLNIYTNNVFLFGDGSGGTSNTTTNIQNTAATIILWGGGVSPSSAVVEFKTLQNQSVRNGGGLSKIFIDCNDECGVGLRLAAWWFGTFENLQILNPTQNGIVLTTVPYLIPFGATTTSENVFRQIFVGVSTSVPSNTSTGILLTSDRTVNTGNSCFNRFYDIRTIAGRGNPEISRYGIVLEDTDNNYFYSIVTQTIVFRGSGPNNGSARFNSLYAVEGNIKAEAAFDNTYNPSRYNSVYGLTNSNGRGIITIDPPPPGGESPVITTYQTNGRVDMSTGVFSGINMPQGTSTGTVTGTFFDRYENGTFEINVEGSTTAGTCTIANRSGRYTRIGDVIFFIGFINYNSHTGSGGLLITGLPYRSRSGSDPSIVGIRPSSLTFSGGELIASVVSGDDVIAVETIATGAAPTAVPIDAAAILQVSGSYLIT